MANQKNRVRREPFGRIGTFSPGRYRQHVSADQSNKGLPPTGNAAATRRDRSPAAGEPVDARASADTARPGAPSRPPRFLVVEDELMIRMLLEDMLTDIGYEVVASAGRLDEAVRFAREADFDVAILDLNLAGQSVAPVAAIIEQRGRPFVFATGYGERGLPEQYRGRPTLQKPFQQDNLDRILARLVPAPID
jgi:CheY-like chemotaxis protein